MAWFSELRGFLTKEMPSFYRDFREMTRLIMNIHPADPGIRIVYGLQTIGVGLDAAAAGIGNYPFRCYLDPENPEDAGVQGGRVWKGTAAVVAADLAPAAVSDGDWFILTITYDDDGADTAVLSKVGAAPTTTITVNNAVANPSLGLATFIIPIAQVDDAAENPIVQRHFGDVWLPKGETWKDRRIYNISYNAGTYVLSYKYRDLTVVAGIEYVLGAEQTVNILTGSDECP